MDCGMNPLDAHVIAFLNQFAQRSWTFDYGVILVSQNYVLKTGILTAMLGWMWFRNGEATGRPRTTVLFGLIASCLAVLAARIMSLLVPFRERPLRIPDLNFVLPHGVNPQAILGWSAFPSDNAALFFGLAATIYLVSRRAGIVAFCHVALVVGFARVYLGFHHPTDILAGAVLGVGAVFLGAFSGIRTAVTTAPLQWRERHPPSFHAALFVLVFLVATTFEPLYPLVGFTATTAKAVMRLTPLSDLTAAVYR
jgi:undecaprenyl-diphosphatase